MKHLLVVDVELTKENKHICKDDNNRCPLWNEEVNLCMYNFNNNTKGCPLKPLPGKIDQGYPCEKYDEGYSDGWDACLDEILGGNE